MRKRNLKASVFCDQSQVVNNLPNFSNESRSKPPVTKSPHLDEMRKGSLKATDFCDQSQIVNNLLNSSNESRSKPPIAKIGPFGVRCGNSAVFIPAIRCCTL
ncbi:hypothetical protein CEXT_680161 [Caerostris extrusa]|uniref:Uncharacterized protein n=1 Tax=Caerostris extrusa TaxID=172846 RepID=A0AAV4M2Q5_CAEEX|nr:hypothetical protein CEXT_680161 [Caerostris extrusa]